MHADSPRFDPVEVADDETPSGAQRPVAYAVRRAAEHWEVVFGDAGACFVYHTRSAALRAARGAARRQWQVRRVPGTVTMEEMGHATLVVAAYGA